jgi:hypothetical protein
MNSREDIDQATPKELADLAEAAVRALARHDDPAAFTYLLRLTRIIGECLGASARTLAQEGSWSRVADIAGTSRQAAWERWHS